MLINFKNFKPKVSKNVFIADGAKIVGNVELKDNCSIWFNAVVRGDINKVIICENTNIQDNCVVHVSDEYGVEIGENVTVGHSAIIHSCKIEKNCLIGMGAVILDGAVIGENSIVGANSVVTSNMIVPKNSLVLGTPAKVVKEIDVSKQNEHHANSYADLCKYYKDE